GGDLSAGLERIEALENEQHHRQGMDGRARFEYKLDGPIPVRFHRGNPTKYEFDVNVCVVHSPEQDCNGLTEIFATINKSWQTQMTFCIYPSKDRARDMILNVRGSPKAPAEID